MQAGRAQAERREQPVGLIERTAAHERKRSSGRRLQSLEDAASAPAPARLRAGRDLEQSAVDIQKERDVCGPQPAAGAAAWSVCRRRGHDCQLSMKSLPRQPASSRNTLDRRVAALERPHLARRAPIWTFLRNAVRSRSPMTPAAGCVLLADRGVLALRGGDARAFLQGLTSNDVARISEDQAGYGALLTPQGKFLFDFFIAQEGAQLLLETELARVEQLQRRLMIYRLRSKVDLEDVSTRFIVAALIGDEIGRAARSAAEPGRRADARSGPRVHRPPSGPIGRAGAAAEGERGGPARGARGSRSSGAQPMNGCGSRSACPTAAAIWWSRSRRSWRAASRS